MKKDFWDELLDIVDTVAKIIGYIVLFILWFIVVLFLVTHIILQGHKLGWW
jgi:uncharacterized membrane protein